MTHNHYIERDVSLGEAVQIVGNVAPLGERLVELVGLWSGPFRVFDGNVSWDGDFEVDSRPLIIWGDLIVDGSLLDIKTQGSLLIVMGSLRSENLITKGKIAVGGDLTVSGAIFGYPGQDGELIVNGRTTASHVVSKSHRYHLQGHASATYVYGHVDGLQHSGFQASELFVPEVLDAVLDQEVGIEVDFDAQKLLQALLNKTPAFQETPTSRRSEMLKSLEVSTKKTSISLEDAGLREIPEEVFQTEGLERLVLDFNELTSLTDRIAELKHLRYLSLDDAPLRQLPEAICDLENLEVLSLRYVKLKSLPSGFARLKSLREIYLTYSALTEFPRVLIDLPALERVSFWHCGESDPQKLSDFISALSEMPRLKFLSFAQGGIQRFPTQIKGLNGLEELQIADQKIPEAHQEELRVWLPGTRLKFSI